MAVLSVQRVREPWMEDRPLERLAQRAHEVERVDRLDDVSSGARLQRGLNVVHVRADREEHHLGLAMLCLDRPDAVEAVVSPQLGIDEDYIRPRSRDHRLHFLGGACLSDDADVVARFEDDSDALERYQLIISEQHAHSWSGVSMCWGMLRGPAPQMHENAVQIAPLSQ